MFLHRLLPLTLLFLSSTALAANPLPTDQDLQQMLDKGDYRACLQQTARVLNLSGDPARNYDPFILQMRRGECLLNLGDNATALAAYTAALHAADDGKKAEQARAMVSLIRASRGLVYTSNGGQPINIVPLADRKHAMAALFADSLPAANQALHAALDASVINPLLDLFPKIQELHALEMLGTGSDEKTQPMLIAMGDRAREMISSELRALADRLDIIRNRANQLVASGINEVSINGQAWWVPDTRIGLSPDDRNALRNNALYLDQLLTLSKAGKQAAQSFGKDGKPWDPLISQATDLLNRAKSILDAE